MVLLLHKIGTNEAPRLLLMMLVCSLSNLLKVVAPISIDIDAMPDEFNWCRARFWGLLEIFHKPVGDFLCWCACNSFVYHLSTTPG